MLSRNKLIDNALIIAEVGQNHQGDLHLAREYIKVFAAAGADVIKFQTRNNKYLSPLTPIGCIRMLRKANNRLILNRFTGRANAS